MRCWVTAVVLSCAALTAVDAKRRIASAAPATPRPGDVESVDSASQARLAGDVCPPFFLRDQAGSIINPVTGQNADQPYSPKQTCGECHDYDKITQGYHFQQGADEKPPEPLASRCQWVSSPGNYGGAWCSPAPLYSYLSPKRNDDEHLIDMTSFVFVTRGCAQCHPGGGPLEYDRQGYRYDQRMADPDSGFTPGGKNNLDGDYYKARWSETGVLEADCLLCHQPEYSFRERNRQLANLNFRWAPTAAAGWGRVEGAVGEGGPVTVVYDMSRFDSQGRVSPHLVREPRNETCLECHAKPGWKKRGANFRPRTDVHLAAGLRCVDCHPAGSHAADPRIQDREMHQIAKGDDPGGLVRNDLDDTMGDCASCHATGELGASIARHPGLPPLHLERIACTTCHIPYRYVKAARAQLSDVFNPGARIPTKGKHLWTFYGPDMKYWNHYGELEMMGYDDKPTDTFRPILARYKGKIYPVNRVHSSWPGIEIDDQPGLMQPRVSDIYKMWTAHRQDASQYPDLAKITDDNDDGVIEVNRPEEIEALISAITKHLIAIGYPMKGKRVVWVCNNRVYSSGTGYRQIETAAWQASAYGNTHKYSHDVLPARSALGAKGCVECHSLDSSMFFTSVVERPFDEQAQAVMIPQYRLLGLSRLTVLLGVFRESYLKSLLYLLWLMLIALLAGWCVARFAEPVVHVAPTGIRPYLPWLVVAGVILGLLPVVLSDELRDYALPSRFWLDSNHFLVATATMVVGLAGLALSLVRGPSGTRRGSRGGIAGRPFLFAVLLLSAIVCGVLMELNFSTVPQLTRYAYTALDVSLVVILLASGVELALAMDPRHPQTPTRRT